MALVFKFILLYRDDIRETESFMATTYCTALAERRFAIYYQKEDDFGYTDAID